MPEEGVFMGGLKDPLYMDELVIWVDQKEVFNEDKDGFEEADGYQISIGGSKRALFELGKALIGLSELETKDDQYHEHLDCLSTIGGLVTCDIILHHTNRFE